MILLSLLLFILEIYQKFTQELQDMTPRRKRSPYDMLLGGKEEDIIQRRTRKTVSTIFILSRYKKTERYLKNNSFKIMFDLHPRVANCKEYHYHTKYTEKKESGY